MNRRTLLALCGLVASPIFGQHCSQALAAHVYHPNRLQVVTECMEVRGTLFDWRVEADGDYHIQIQLDAMQPDGEAGRSLLNARNRKVRKAAWW